MIKILKWPRYSPDLNPIENLWNINKERIHKAYPDLAGMPKNNTSKQRLVEAAVAMWEDLEDDLLKKLVETVPRRLQAVTDAQGWYTKY
jgi:transposase